MFRWQSLVSPGYRCCRSRSPLRRRWQRQLRRSWPRSSHPLRLLQRRLHHPLHPLRLRPAVLAQSDPDLLVLPAQQSAAQTQSRTQREQQQEQQQDVSFKSPRGQFDVELELTLAHRPAVREPPYRGRDWLTSDKLAEREPARKRSALGAVKAVSGLLLGGWVIEPLCPSVLEPSFDIAKRQSSYRRWSPEIFIPFSGIRFESQPPSRESSGGVRNCASFPI